MANYDRDGRYPRTQVYSSRRVQQPRTPEYPRYSQARDVRGGYGQEYPQIPSYDRNARYAPPPPYVPQYPEDDGSGRRNPPPHRGKRRRGGFGLILLAAAIAIAVLIATKIHAPEKDAVAGTNQQTTSSAETTTDALSSLNAQAQQPDTAEQQREGVYTILLVGTDKDGTRTDSIVMITLDSVQKTVHMLNVPRDTMSMAADGSIHKINAAFGRGISRTVTEVSKVVGYTPNRYVVVDYEGFKRLIDAIGGVEIDVPMAMYYSDPTQDLLIDLQPGLQNLDGKSALEYMRFRSGYATADLGRIDAQQVLYKAVLEKLCRPSTLLKAGNLAAVLLECVDTDLTLGEITWFALQFYNMDTASGITTATLPVEPTWYHKSSYVTVSAGKALELINSGFNPYTTDITGLTLAG